MKAIGYIRVSTKEQTEQGQSLFAQKQTIKEYCILNKMELIDIITETNVSGSTEINRRPAGQKIQQHIDSGAKHIISIKLDRMFRNVIDALSQTEKWAKQDVAIHFVDFGGNGALDTSSPIGRILFTLMASFAELELSQIKSRTKAAMQHKISKGEFTGQLPFGYKKNGIFIEKITEYDNIIKFIKDLKDRKFSSRFIAEGITEKYKISCSHSTINKLMKKNP